MRERDFEALEGPNDRNEREDMKIAPKFNKTKIKRQVRRLESERKAETEADARLNLALHGVLNADGSFKKF